jgi:hypothetical protein
MGELCVDFDVTRQLLIGLIAHDKNASTLALVIYGLQESL